MSDYSPLHVLFSHNLWANLTLLDACANLSDEQIDAEDPGSYGTIRKTLLHIVSAESYYLWVLQDRPGELRPLNEENPSLAELRTVMEASSQSLIEVALTAKASESVDIKTSEGEYELPSPYLLTQIIHHGNEHRTNITSTLARDGIDAPDISSWNYFRELKNVL
jgi:uncharacterized damage-inducible protein DinB